MSVELKLGHVDTPFEYLSDGRQLSGCPVGVSFRVKLIFVPDGPGLVYKAHLWIDGKNVGYSRVMKASGGEGCAVKAVFCGWRANADCTEKQAFVFQVPEEGDGSAGTIRAEVWEGTYDTSVDSAELGRTTYEEDDAAAASTCTGPSCGESLTSTVGAGGSLMTGRGKRTLQGGFKHRGTWTDRKLAADIQLCYSA